MRSRYTAYSEANIDYIIHTMQGKPLERFNKEEAAQWAKEAKWLGLKVLNASQKGNQGWVEFIAKYSLNNELQILHELSEFKLENGHWYYVDSHTPKKPGRNDACICGSGRKFKKCCGLGN